VSEAGDFVVDGITVDPVPSDEEMAAIMAAHEALWPRPSAATASDEPSRWRFSGRWWAPRPRYGGWA